MSYSDWLNGNKMINVSLRGGNSGINTNYTGNKSNVDTTEQTPYQTYLNAINEQWRAGKINANEYKQLMLQSAEEEKEAYYETADRRLAESEAIANQSRERALVNADTSYRQNLAAYGANAEAMANMGLTGSGYSDWLNASAYAQNRGDVQAANAQYDTAKREAKYIADQTKNEADINYNDAVLNANAEYLDTVNKLDTSYKTNLAEYEATNRQNQINTKLELKSNLSSTTTDQEIDNYVKDGLITENDAAELKNYRGTIGNNEIKYYLQSGDYLSATSKADELYNNGKGVINKDTYQNVYFEAEKSNISSNMSASDVINMKNELKKAVATGKISQTDADNLIDYMYKTSAKVLNDGYGVTAKFKNNGNVKRVDITIGETTYSKMQEKDPVDKHTQDLLNDIARGQSLVMLGNKLYVKVPTKGWYAVKDNNSLNSKYYQLASYNGAPTAPNHAQ